MSTEVAEKPKTTAEKLGDIVSQLKEMEHYSRANIEKLTSYWLVFEEDKEMKNKEFSEEVTLLMNAQGSFEDEIQKLIEQMVMAVNRMEQDS